jgi:exodeoxyribonuclease V alpha subunit
MIALTGEVRRVLFCDDGFAIVRLATGKDETTVKGPFPAARVGMTLSCEGEQRVHPRYGPFFAAKTIREELPTSDEAIQKYLASAKIPGIGKRTAEKLVAHFGTDVFAVLDSHGDRLSEIARLPTKTRTKILIGWQTARVTYKVMLFLTSIGIAAGTANRVVRELGGETPDESTVIDQIRKDPYVLSEISGIGFRTADSSALALGFARNSRARLSAGLVHGLQELALRGHTMATTELLIETTAQLLGVDEFQLHDELDSRVREEDGPLVGTIHGGLPCVALRPLHCAELGIAKELTTFFDQPGILKTDDAKLTGTLPTNGLTLVQKQEEGVHQALTSRFSVLTGGPGTGKTCIVRTIVQIAESAGAHVELCAPTGRAAKRLSAATGRQAQTIHRLLGYRGHTITRTASNPIECDLLIIDETSMVDVFLFYHLIRAVPAHASVLLVGDVDQLPSVGAGNILGDVIDSGRVPVVRLSQVFRQGTDSGIVTGAQAIIHGEWPTFGEDFTFIESKADEHAIESADAKTARWVIDAVSKLVERGAQAGDIQVISPMRKGPLGITALNEVLQARLNPSNGGAEFAHGASTFRLGDRVMQIRNNYDLGIMNGDIGYIRSIDLDEDEILIDFEGDDVMVSRGDFDDLTLAYASTVHKAQGGEFPYIIVGLAMHHYVMLHRNLIYTALTRAKTRAIFIGSKKALRIAISTKRDLERLTGLHEALRQAATVGSS